MTFDWKKLKSNYALLVSILMHAVIFAALAGHPIKQIIQDQSGNIDVEWVKNVADPKLKEAVPPKQPLNMNFSLKRDLESGSKKKTVLATNSKLAWVLKKSDREVKRSVEINDSPRSRIIPELMTAAQVKDSAYKLSSMISTAVGPVDGDGIVGNQVRAKGTGGEGDRSGATIIGLGGKGNGLYGDGLGGGSGNGGGKGRDGVGRPFDRLGIIKFIEESQGKSKIIFLLDVSASMAMGSKLDVSIKAIKESLLQLEDSDLFNIVTFYASVRGFKEQLVPASMDNIKKANKFLNSFTTRSVENNMGTDILGALKFALNLEPAVIVLVTDIQPTRGEVDEDLIAEEVKKINKNTKIYGVGVEVWEPSPTGRLAKLLKLLTEQNKGEMKLAKASG